MTTETFAVLKTRKHGSAIIMLILCFYAFNPLLFAKLVDINSKHHKSLQGYETSTRMLFHAILMQNTKFGKLRTIVLLLVFDFLSVIFVTFFKL